MKRGGRGDVIDASDAVYANLLEWRDANLDGVSQVGEWTMIAANENRGATEEYVRTAGECC
jgi:hypothetical protein